MTADRGRAENLRRLAVWNDALERHGFTPVVTLQEAAPLDEDNLLAMLRETQTRLLIAAKLNNETATSIRARSL